MAKVDFTLMMTGAFSQNVGKLFSELKLVTDNLFMQKPTENRLIAKLHYLPEKQASKKRGQGMKNYYATSSSLAKLEDV